MCRYFACRFSHVCDDVVCDVLDPIDCTRVFVFELQTGAISCRDMCCACMHATFVTIGGLIYAVCRKK